MKLNLIVAAILLTTVTFGIAAKNLSKVNENSFQTPDFAYPQTVEKNAEAALKKGAKSGDGITVVLAGIQLTIARDLRSSDEFTRGIALFDSLANTQPAPYSSLCRLLEAQIYAEVYSDSRWQYDRRTLPADSVPASPLEWDGRMFRAKIASLLASVRAQGGADSAVPLSRISGLLVESDDAVKAGFSVADFTAIRSIYISRMCGQPGNLTIPFGPAGSGQSNGDAIAAEAMGALDAAIARHEHDADLRGLASLYQLKQTAMPQYAQKEFAEKCMKRFIDTPYCVSFINDYCDMLDQEKYNDANYDDGNDSVGDTAALNALQRRKLAIYDDYIARFPEAENIWQLKNARSTMFGKNVWLTIPERVIPGADVKVKAQLSNVYGFYALLFKVNVKDDDENFELINLRRTARPVASVYVKADGTSPDRADTTFTIRVPEAGHYILLPSNTPDAKGLISNVKRAQTPVITASALSWAALPKADGNGSRLYITDARTGGPAAGVTVSFYSSSWNDRRLIGTATTDADGACDVPAYRTGVRYLAFAGKRGDDTVNGSLATSAKQEETAETRHHADVLTDLTLFRPGDEVKFAVVAYDYFSKENRVAPMADTKIIADLIGANWQKVDSLELTTSSMGRADGRLTIPKSGMLGLFQVRVRLADNGKKESIGSEIVEVAEYKAPTFYVETRGADGNVTPGDTVKITGRAMTYAGMPVAGAEVKYTVRYRQPWWRWRSFGDATYSGTTVTGADGSFSFGLDTAGLKGTAFADGNYTVSVDVTDAAGETREAPAAWFSTAAAFRIAANIPGEVEIPADNQKKFTVSVSDASGNPAVKTVYYRLLRDGGKETTPLKNGEFLSPSMSTDFAGVPSGKYDIEFSLDPEFKGGDHTPNSTAEVILYRAVDSQPPVETSLWLPESEKTVPAGAKSVTLRVGSSYPDNYVLARIVNGDKAAETRWVKVDKGFVTVNLPAPADNERGSVVFLSTRDFKQIYKSVTLVPAKQRERLAVKSETFRDRIEPGARETWKFRFEIDGKPMANIPVMAVMSDRSLNSIYPFEWNLNPRSSLSRGVSNSMSFDRPGFLTGYTTVAQDLIDGKLKQFILPTFQTYGYSLYQEGTVYYNFATLRSARPMKMAAMQTKGESNDMAGGMEVTEEEAAIESSDAAVGATDGGILAEEKVKKNKEPEVTLRSNDCPLAFFMPALVTDANGIATVEFEAPQFVGTWQFQIAGYTSDMLSAVSSMEAVSAKRVMAQLNAPRFLRTGDKAAVAATLFNNSDKAMAVSGKIEIVDPLSGKVIASVSPAATELAPSASTVISIEYPVSAEYSELAIRAYAFGDGCSDGEQTIISVYPSSTPVTESTTFYFQPGVGDKEVKLPKFEKGSKVTLQYCDNPVWEVVTALPGIVEPGSVNTLSQAEALYGNAVAAGICKNYPDIAKALREMADPSNAADSTLVSNLQKNSELKTVALNNTPWVNSAAAETLRMSSLTDYTDSDRAQKAVDAIMATLKKTQMADGGWSWCPDMRSSEYITGRVLLTLSMLRTMGYLPDGAEAMAKKAFAFCDKELTDAWIESGRNGGKRRFSVSSLLNYLYIKSAFPQMKATNGFGALEREAMKAVRGGWKGFSIYDKATAATLLSRRNEPKAAAGILESLRQYAMSTPEKGMWYDNLDSSWDGFNRLITTAQVLEAFAEIEPQAPSVDALRQWLLLSKQTEDWGDRSNTCEVIHAILTTGTKWTAPSAQPVITLDGKRIEPPHIAKYTGSFTMTLGEKEASGKKLSIAKSSEGPAWGGVMAQYVSPILDVKPASVNELRIEKSVYSIGADGVGTAGKVKTGDRIRVTLTIVCDRDMDYVAVTDGRSACLEPAEQLSGYTSSDGLWFYREVRNDATNLFIPFLPKGTHVISYDCFADREGTYSLGIATAQSQYAPMIVAHSAGALITVEK